MKLIFSLLLACALFTFSSSAQSLTPGQVTDNVYNKALLAERFTVSTNKSIALDHKEINFTISYDSKHNTFTNSNDLSGNKEKVVAVAVKASNRFPGHASNPKPTNLNFMQLQLNLQNKDAMVTVNNLKINGMDITGSYTANTDGIIYWHLVYEDFGKDFTLSGTINLNGNFSGKNATDMVEFNFGNSNSLMASALSVYWGDVIAEAKNNANIINWNTNKEENSDRFVIERAPDGINFTGIGLINSMGNKTTATTYNFADCEFVEGVSYYRIKQVDMDGRASYSVVVRVANSNSNTAQYASNSTVDNNTAGKK